MIVALYARVSTAKQAEKELSIPDQVRQMQEWCKRQGYAVAVVYEELGASATDDRRPVFQQMIAEACASPSPFDAIIVHSLSRFYRDALEFGLYERKLSKHDVRVISVTQQTSDDPAGEMARKIFSLFDEYQSKENGKHTLRAMQENARQGYFNGSHPPFGYRAVPVDIPGRRDNKKKLHIDMVEALTVNRIFKFYLEGYRGKVLGVAQVAALLNEQGITRRGNRWSKTTISELLANPVYIGEYYFNRTQAKTQKQKPQDEWVFW